MTERITSRKNPLLQQVRKLLTSRKEREQTGLFVADGTKLLEEAVKWAPETLRTVLVTKDVVLPQLPEKVRLVEIPDDIMAQVMEYIDKLTAEIAALEQLGDQALIGIDNGAVYMLDNIMYQGYYMYLGSNNEVDAKTVPYGDVACWVFEKAAGAGSYYIKNRSNNRYIGVLNAASRQVYAGES